VHRQKEQVELKRAPEILKREWLRGVKLF